jgi:hypothetical protein
MRWEKRGSRSRDGRESSTCRSAVKNPGRAEREHGAIEVSLVENGIRVWRSRLGWPRKSTPGMPALSLSPVGLLLVCLSPSLSMMVGAAGNGTTSAGGLNPRRRFLDRRLRPVRLPSPWRYGVDGPRGSPPLRLPRVGNASS